MSMFRSRIAFLPPFLAILLDQCFSTIFHLTPNSLTLVTLKCRLDVRITTLNTEDIKERRKVAEDKLSGDDKAEDKQQKQSGLFKWYFWSFGFVLLSVLGYLGFLIYVSWPISTYSIDKSALLGDSFGILSSLFSGLAFAGLIVTLAMQRKTLDAQMEELALARQEYKRQGDALKGQEAVMSRQFEAIRLQSYEGTLNRLLDLKEAVMKEKINLNVSVR